MKDYFKTELLNARKEKNKYLIGNYQLIIAKIENAEISVKRSLTNSEVYAIIRKSISDINDRLAGKVEKDVYVEVNFSPEVIKEETEFRDSLQDLLPEAFTVDFIVSIYEKENVDKSMKDGPMRGLIMKRYKDNVTKELVDEAILKYKSI